MYNLYQGIKHDNLSFDDFSSKAKQDDILSRLTKQELQDIYNALKHIIYEHEDNYIGLGQDKYNITITPNNYYDDIDLLQSILYISENYSNLHVSKYYFDLYTRLITIYTSHFSYDIQEHLTKILQEVYKSIGNGEYYSYTTLEENYKKSIGTCLIISLEHGAEKNDLLLGYIRKIDHAYNTNNYLEKIYNEHQDIIKDPGYD